MQGHSVLMMHPEVETGIRAAAASPKSPEREGAGTSEKHAGKEPGSWSIPSVPVWATVQQRVRFPYSSFIGMLL
jgi:hypothetical protein